MENQKNEINEEIFEFLRNVLGCDDINSDAVNEWMKEDDVNEFTDCDIIDLVNTEPAPVKEEEHKQIFTHCEAFQAFECSPVGPW